MVRVRPHAVPVVDRGDVLARVCRRAVGVAVIQCFTKG